MHTEVMDFCRRELRRYLGPVARVLDVGSFNMNGSTRELFAPGVAYVGIDIHPGKGVDWVGAAHDFPASEGWDGEAFDALVSTECLEYDKHWERTLDACCRLVRPGGLVLITCASGGRAPHYTECWPDGYYRNLFARDVVPVLEAAGVCVLRAEQVRQGLDLQVVGVREDGAEVTRRDDREEPAWEELDPGISEAVRLLWDAGFQTTDSGDGSKAGSQEGALPYPHVFAVVEPARMAAEADRARGVPWGVLGLGEPEVEATYSPDDGVAVLAVSWPPPPPEEPEISAPEGLEVLEGDGGSLLWVELDGYRRLLVERGEQPCGLDPEQPLGRGVRLAFQDQGVGSLVLPEQEALRLADRVRDLARRG